MNKIIKETKESLKDNWVLYNIPHSFISSPNLTSTLSSYSPINFYSSNPIPLYLETIRDIPNDVCSQVVLKKDMWSAKISSIKKEYRRSKTIQQLTKQSCDQFFKKGEIPKYLSDFCIKLSQDPDIYFQGTYNWYFTNGNLDSYENNDKQIIFHTSGPTQNILNVSSINFNRKNTKRKLVNEWKSKQYKDSIFEIAYKNVNNNIFTYNRQKNNIFVNKLYYDDDNTIRLKNVHDNKKFRVPLISVTTNNYIPHEYYTVDVNRCFQIWDINSLKANKIKIDKSSSIDNWSYLTSFSNPFNIIYLDRENISLIDLRTKNQTQSQFVKNVLFDCDYYSIALPSAQIQNHIYIGSNHSVFVLDIRNTKSILTKWTHMMNSVPYLMRSLINLNCYEMLTISSPLEKSIILNSSTNNDVISSTPLAIKSLDLTLKSTNLNGQCLHPKSLIRNCINYCTTGITMFKFNCVHYLLSQNSLGNLFIQKLSENPMEDDSIFTYNTKKVLNKKIKSSLSTKPFHCLSMKHLFEGKEYKKKRMKKKVVNKPTIPVLENEPWKRSILSLRLYNDVLSPSLLQTWGYITEGEANLRTILPTTSDDKVTSWLADVSNVNGVLNEILCNESTMQQSSQGSTAMFSSQDNKTSPLVRKAVKRKRISGF